MFDQFSVRPFRHSSIRASQSASINPHLSLHFSPLFPLLFVGANWNLAKKFDALVCGVCCLVDFVVPISISQPAPELRAAPIKFISSPTGSANEGAPPPPRPYARQELVAGRSLAGWICSNSFTRTTHRSGLIVQTWKRFSSRIPVLMTVLMVVVVGPRIKD